MDRSIKAGLQSFPVSWQFELAALTQRVALNGLRHDRCTTAENVLRHLPSEDRIDFAKYTRILPERHHGPSGRETMTGSE